jgi:hypothetical protein
MIRRDYLCSFDSRRGGASSFVKLSRLVAELHTVFLRSIGELESPNESSNVRARKRANW